MRATRVPVGALTLALLAGCGGDATPGAGDTGPVLEIPEGTDVWIAELREGDQGNLGLVGLRDVTNRAGYDNQPSFTPDGAGILYTRIDAAGQADIWRYDVETDSVMPLTRTAPESEYSATPLEGGGFAVVRVEADSTQRLWRFSDDGTPAGVVFEDVMPVGYFAWADERTPVMFVLGDPPTLQVGDVETGAARVVARSIGRSIQRIPGSNDVSFVQHSEDGEAWITRLNPVSGQIERLVRAVDDGDFHAWTPDGRLLMASGGRLFSWTPGDEDWAMQVDLSALGISMSRLAVSADGTRIALVAEPAEGS